MMNSEDLKKVLFVANHGNLQSSASELNVTPSALSKAIKRIEKQLNCQLFSRHGKTITLNQQGKVFLRTGAALMQEIEQFSHQFKSSSQLPEIRLAGPAILTSYFSTTLIKCFANQQPIRLLNYYEDSAAEQVLSGAADLALITQEAKQQLNSDTKCALLNIANFSLVSSSCFKTGVNFPLDTKEVQTLPFAAPKISPFCGQEQSWQADGWPDNQIQRQVKFQCDDWTTLLQLVKQGMAVAYLPEFVVQNEQLERLEVKAMDNHYQERIYLMWSPTKCDGWLNQLMDKVEQNIAIG